MTPRELRVVRAGAAVLMVILGLRAVSWGFRHYQALNEDLTRQRAILARMQETVLEVGDLSDSSESIRRRFVGLASAVLAGGTEAGAVASLTGQLNAVADRSRMKLERTDVVPDTVRAGRLRRASVRASLEGDARGVTAALHAIDTAQVALAIGASRIVALDPMSADNAPERLNLEILVSGWYVERADQ